MANSTKTLKPAKPYRDFPLFAHGNHQWAKKIKGKLFYFGKWDDPEAALQSYLDQRDDLHAGRVPRVKRDGLTIRELCNHYLSVQETRRDSGDLSPRTFAARYKICGILIEHFGKDLLVEDLIPEDFDKLRAERASGRAARTLAGEVTMVRGIFKHANEYQLTEKLVPFGPNFKKPRASIIRAENNAILKKGLRMFTPAELRGLIDGASQPLKSMILLGANCGFGNADVGQLPKSAIDLEGGWIDFPRVKTAVERRCPLWPETVKALREAIKLSREPADEANADLVFLTHRGNPWANETPNSPITRELKKLLRRLELLRPGLTFYSLRRTFQTAAESSLDFPAISSIMGHIHDNNMAGIYRQTIVDERLTRVTAHVRSWLYTDNIIK